MKKILPFFILIACFPMLKAYASREPANCPSVNAIQQVGFRDGVEREGNGKWVAITRRNYFATKDCWQFNTNSFEAKDESEAINKAKAALSTLQFVQGPSQLGTDWVCNYHTNLGDAFAVTPTFYECD